MGTGEEGITLQAGATQAVATQAGAFKGPLPQAFNKVTDNHAHGVVTSYIACGMHSE